MSKTLDEQMAEIAKQVARRYYSRCWWADLRDLEQQAWVVVLEVLREYAPLASDGSLDREAFGSWAYSAAMRQMSRYLWRLNSPVSTSDHDVKNMRNVFHVEVPTTLVDHEPTPEDLVVAVQVQTVVLPAVKERICALYTRVPWYAGPDVWLQATLAIYLDGKAPREAAADLGVNVRDVYKTTEHMRMMMRADRKLRQLVSEVQEGRI